MMVVTRKIGRIDISALKIPPSENEFLTAKFLSSLGKDVVFIAPDRTPTSKTPDILMDGVGWEIKSPRGNSLRTIENNFRNAVKQSFYLIFDLRHTHLKDQDCLKKLQKEFSLRKKLKNYWLLLNQNGSLTLKSDFITIG
jgi:hypothetical protein